MDFESRGGCLSIVSVLSFQRMRSPKENDLELMPGEKLLREAGSPSSDLHFALTTHRVRFRQTRLGRGEIVSIMLEHVASCAMVQRSRPILLGFAGFSIFVGFLSAAENDWLASLGVATVIAAVLLFFYFSSRRPFLELGSAGATIRMRTSGMSLTELESFIDSVEVAKHAR